MKNSSWVSWILLLMFVVGSAATVTMSGCGKKQVDPAAPRSFSNDGDEDAE